MSTNRRVLLLRGAASDEAISVYGQRLLRCARNDSLGSSALVFVQSFVSRPLAMKAAGRSVHGTSSRPQRHCGFALTELMVAIAILAIVVAIGTPNMFATAESYRLRGATWEIYSQLQAARMAAVKENNRFHFSVSGPSLRIHDDDNNDDVEDVGEQIVTKDVSSGSSGVAFTASDVVTFRTDGTTVGSVTFTITNQSGHTKSVVVSRAGRVRIQ